MAKPLAQTDTRVRTPARLFPHAGGAGRAERGRPQTDAQGAESRTRTGSAGYDSLGGRSTLLPADMTHMTVAPAPNTATSSGCSGEAWDTRDPSQATKKPVLGWPGHQGAGQR